MEFFIRQGASEPILKMKLIDDGKNDKSSFNELLINSNITLDLFDVETGEPEIQSRTASDRDRPASPPV